MTGKLQLKRWRVKAGVSLAAIARAINSTEKYVEQIENEWARTSPETAEKLERFTEGKVKLDYFMRVQPRRPSRAKDAA